MRQGFAMPKFEKRIYLGIGLIIAGFIPLIVASFMALRYFVKEQNDIISNNVNELLIAERLRYIDSTSGSLMPLHVISGEMRLVSQLEKRAKEFEQLTDELLQKESNPATVQLVKKIQEQSLQLFAASKPGIDRRQNGSSIDKGNTYFAQTGAPIAGELKDLLKELTRQETEDLNAAKERLSSAESRMILGLTIFAIFILVLVGGIARLMVKVLQQKRIYDESQLALLERERKLSKARKETVEVVSHDLKSPLSTVQMSINLMLDQITEPSIEAIDLREGLLIANRSAESMQKLIMNLLDHAKIEAGQMVLEKQKVNLENLLGDLKLRFEPLASNKNISLTLNLAGSGFIADCDSTRLEQVLSNLITNAIKFSPTQSNVDISLQSKDESVLISVADAGPGIDSEQISHVFDRYWQVRKTANQGTGLGLAIAKAIVTAHNGKIWVESEIGHGSKFFIELPVKKLTSETSKLSFSAERPLEV